MIAATAHLFTADVLDQAVSGLGLSSSSLLTHEGFCSHVFSANRGSDRVILKLSHSSRIRREALDSELDFVRHLHRSGVPVCEPLTSPEEVLEIPDGAEGRFFAYLYRKVEGEEFDRSRRSQADFESAGSALGLLHRASASFDYAAHPARLSFLDGEFLDFESILPPQEVDTRRCFRRIVDDLRELPASGETYGMTHGDSHDGNLLLAESGVSIIDFDDVEPGFFLNDVAVFIDSVCDRDGCEDSEWVGSVFSSFLRGYSRHQEVPVERWGWLPAFMRYRWIMNHCVFQMLRGHLVDADPELKAKRDRRIEMYRSNFARYDYLYGFDFVGAARRLR